MEKQVQTKYFLIHQFTYPIYRNTSTKKNTLSIVLLIAVSQSLSSIWQPNIHIYTLPIATLTNFGSPQEFEDSGESTFPASGSLKCNHVVKIPYSLAFQETHPA